MQKKSSSQEHRPFLDFEINNEQTLFCKEITPEDSQKVGTKWGGQNVCKMMAKECKSVKD